MALRFQGRSQLVDTVLLYHSPWSKVGQLPGRYSLKTITGIWFCRRCGSPKEWWVAHVYRSLSIGTRTSKNDHHLSESRPGIATMTAEGSETIVLSETAGQVCASASTRIGNVSAVSQAHKRNALARFRHSSGFRVGRQQSSTSPSINLQTFASGHEKTTTRSSVHGSAILPR